MPRQPEVERLRGGEVAGEVALSEKEGGNGW